jgi:hypothetical protein
VRGLWYFFGIVVAAGIFTGIAGLGIGHVAGIVWEQVHRHLRHKRLIAKERAEAAATPPNSEAVLPGPPKLTLIPPDESAIRNVGDSDKGGRGGRRPGKR